MTNSRQARKIRRIDPHARCREDFELVDRWLKIAKKESLILESKNRLLRRAVFQWRAATLGLALTGSIVYGVWLIQTIIN